jgi:ribosomal protein S12 methylthiotransferase accessory factor
VNPQGTGWGKERKLSGYPSPTPASKELGPELLRQFGITRVGDITGLDTIGIPVWFATRPNSRGLSVSQGKGLSARQARISAIMEAIEGAVAENVREHVAEFGSLRQLGISGKAVVPFANISRVRSDLFDEDRERAWVQGYSCRNGSSVLAPYELIGMDFRSDFPWDRQAVEMGSQGLAAGFRLENAIQHALLELMENDACFLLDTFGASGVGSFECAFEPDVMDELDQALALVRAADIEPIFVELPARFGLPIVFAAIPRPFSGPGGPTTRWSAGVACRFNAYEAALAALLEAVQSRLTDISGARDDLTGQRYQETLIGKALSSTYRKKKAPTNATMDFLDVRLGEERAGLLANFLLNSGIDDIYVFPLAAKDPSICVVRVVAPGLAIAGASESRFHLAALHQFLGHLEATE